MITILYPEIIRHLATLSYGLMPFYLPKKEKIILTVKITKEAILAAKINNSFKIYMIKDPVLLSN